MVLARRLKFLLYRCSACVSCTWSFLFAFARLLAVVLLTCYSTRKDGSEEVNSAGDDARTSTSTTALATTEVNAAGHDATLTSTTVRADRSTKERE